MSNEYFFLTSRRRWRLSGPDGRYVRAIGPEKVITEWTADEEEAAWCDSAWEESMLRRHPELNSERVA